MRKMKRPLITILLIVGCFLVETMIFKKITFANITPNLLVIVTASFGVMRGKREGMLVGFVSGLMLDVFFGELLGFYALLYLLLGYMNGFFQRVFYSEDIKLPLFMIGASDFVLGNFIFLFRFVMRGQFDYGYYLGHIILPELIYTLLITLVLYRVILIINNALEAEEKRSASKFV